MNLTKALEEAMRKDKFKCPYCCVYALFQFKESRNLSSEEIRESNCPSCGRAVVQIRELNWTVTPRPLGGGLESKQHPGKWIIVWPKIRLCCSDERIPSEIRDDLNRANSIFDISPDAGANLVRRALERILRKYLKLSGKTLENLIAASESVLHPRIFKLLDAVRGFGNFGAHLKEDSESGECLFVTEDEFISSIEVVLALAEDEFIHKSDSEKALQKLDLKRERAKK